MAKFSGTYRCRGSLSSAGTRQIKKLAGLVPAIIIVLFSGCFSIPFLSKKPALVESEEIKKDFDRTNVFVGYADKKKTRPIVELQLLSQEITKNGLIIHTRLYPTENFQVRNIFRGLRSIDYYPIERRFHRLELRFGRKKIKCKVEKNLEVKGQTPLEANFVHSGIYTLLPDTIELVKLKFQDVDQWDRLPEDTLDVWYESKQEFQNRLRQQAQRNDLLDTYRMRQRKEALKFSQYDSLYVTANNTYVYLDKSTDSDILYTLNAGDRIDFGVSDGLWVEFPLSDSLKIEFEPQIQKKHQKAVDEFNMRRAIQRVGVRAAAGAQQAEVDTTMHYTAYVLDVMVSNNYNRALGWERAHLVKPVDVPYFAQVLRDREAAEQARLDSLARAQVIADSLRADSLAALSAAKDSSSSGGAAPAVKPPAQGAPVTEKPAQTDSLSGKNTPGNGRPGEKAPVDSVPGAEEKPQPPPPAAQPDSAQSRPAQPVPVDSLPPRDTGADSTTSPP